ncbi:hypothetical protein EDB83DRAFT_2630769 [Lactarius deliciosus]|nr:hypothetical protein EDB83DRAFT_2630769 [Lactarius deliciosus]
MNHVWEGCLARERQDIHSDGSRVEGPHKGWNSLQHAQLCGLAVLVAFDHDHVLPWNIRIVHHTRLDNYTAKFWNKFRLSKHGNSPGLLALPEVSSNETFGLVNSECTTTFRGLFSEVNAAPKTEDPLGPDEDSDLDLERQGAAHFPSSQIVSPAVHAKDRNVLPQRSAARPVEQTQNGMGRMGSPSVSGPCSLSLPPKRRATERIDSIREGPERPPANKRLRTTTTLPPRARTSGTGGRRPHRLPNPLPSTTQHAFPPPEGAGLTRSRRLFTISTGVHIGSLTISRGDEFFPVHEAVGTALVGVVPNDAAEVGRSSENHFNAELEPVNCSNNRMSITQHSRTRAPLWPCWGPSKRRSARDGQLQVREGHGGLLVGALPHSAAPEGGSTRQGQGQGSSTGSLENHKRGYCSDGVEAAGQRVPGVISRRGPSRMASSRPTPGAPPSTRSPFWPPCATSSAKLVVEAVKDRSGLMVYEKVVSGRMTGSGIRGLHGDAALAHRCPCQRRHSLSTIP